MLSREIEEFAKALIKEVRDASIGACDARLEPQAKSPVAKRWRAPKLKREDAQMIIADTVDNTLFQLLDAIDNGLIRLKYIGEDGKEVDLTEEGMAELAGQYTGGSWRSRFSRERVVDDFPDLVEPPH